MAPCAEGITGEDPAKRRILQTTTLAQNQWASGSFWSHVDDAICEENCLPELANKSREEMVAVYLHGWLMLSWPAGNC